MAKKENHVGVKMDADLKDKAERLAADDSRSLSGYIRKLITDAWAKRGPFLDGEV